MARRSKLLEVSVRALLLRVNKILEGRDRVVRRARPNSAQERCAGRFFVVHLRRNVVVSDFVDLERLARELGALEPYEVLEAETRGAA